MQKITRLFEVRYKSEEDKRSTSEYQHHCSEKLGVQKPRTKRSNHDPRASHTQPQRWRRARVDGPAGRAVPPTPTRRSLRLLLVSMFRETVTQWGVKHRRLMLRIIENSFVANMVAISLILDPKQLVMCVRVQQCTMIDMWH